MKEVGADNTRTVPGFLGSILKRLGYSTLDKYPNYRTFYIRDGVRFFRVWIGGFSPSDDLIPAPTWRMLWNDLLGSWH